MTNEVDRSAIQGIVEAFRVAAYEGIGGYWDIEGDDWKAEDWTMPDGWSMVLYEFGNEETLWARTGRRVVVTVSEIGG